MVLSITFRNGDIKPFNVRFVSTSFVKNAVSFQPSLYFEMLFHERGKGVDIPMGDILYFEIWSKNC